mgnify:CR=1 FL=1
MNIIQKFKEFFTPTKVKELEEKVLQLEQKLPVLQKGVDLIEEIENSKIEKLISKILYNVNTKNIDVILNNGNVLSSIVEKDVYEKIRNCNDESLILELISPPKIEEKNGSDFDIDIEKTITPLIKILSNNDNFEIEGDKVYLKGIKSIAIPSPIVAYFIFLLENINNTSNINEINNLKEQFEIIKLFTLKLLANPIEESRNTLLNFVKTNHVQLTPSGNICLYRRFVTKKSGNKELESFVTQRYLKIKQNKKSPSNYNIFLSDNNYFTKNKDIIKLENAEFIGNLNEIYRNLQKVTDIIYTDNHTQSYSISIPGIYKIREQDIDKNRNGSCGGFLHAASLDFDYSSFGDQDTLVIINPMNAAKMDTGVKSKIGVTEMYVACTIDKNCKNIKDLDFINFDTEYEKLTLEEIKSALNNKSLQSFSITDEITSFNYQNLQTLKEILEKRIIKI